MSARSKGNGRWAIALLAGCVALLLAAPVAAASGTIKGLVTSTTSSGKGVGQIEVEVFNPIQYSGTAGTAVTSESGYSVTVPAGKYRVGFGSSLDDPLNYITAYYKSGMLQGAPQFSEATEVSVSEGGTLTGINAELRPGGLITGTVTDAKTHLPLAGIHVASLAEQGLDTGTFAISNGSGDYTLAGVPSGPTYVAFQTMTESGVLYSDQIYNGETFASTASSLEEILALGTTVNVTTLDTTPGVDAAMVREEPVDTAAPVVTGTPAVGYPLSCTTGTWTGIEPLTYTYAWLRDGTPISGASASIYVAQAADQGHVLLCEVTGTNKIGSATAVSNTVTVPAPIAVGVTPIGILPAVSTPVPVITLPTSRLVVSGNAAKVPITCSTANCAGSIELTEQVPAKAKKGKKTTSKKQTVVLAKGSYSLAAGKSATIVVRLTVAGKTALAAAKKHVLPAKGAATVAGGTTVQKPVVLSETAPAKRK
jgi:hypothetical protein